MSEFQNFYLIFDRIPFIHPKVLNSVGIEQNMVYILKPYCYFSKKISNIVSKWFLWKFYEVLKSI